MSDVENERLKDENQYLQRIIQTQEITNKLLQISLTELSLTKLLELSIDHIVSAPLLPFKSKGVIFLIEDDPEVLVLKAQRGLPDYLLTACAKVPFGQCLCGKAAQRKEIVFASCLNADHDITYEGMAPHGHYCVPILSETKLLGVITLYVDDGHEFQTKEYEFIQAIGNVIAGMVFRRQAEIELKQTQLRVLQAGKLAAIGHLAAGIAHEINNPLGFIGSNLDTFGDYTSNFLAIIKMTDTLVKSIENNQPEKAKEIAEEIKKMEEDRNLSFFTQDVNDLINESKVGVDRIMKIIIDLKRFSGQRKDLHEALDFKKILEGVLTIVMNEIKYKVELKTDYGETPEVKGDPQKIGQVFINLIINAAQSIESQGTITIKTYGKDDAAFISISDTGRGIPKEDLNSIFDPFFTTKPVGQGTGLGLSISYDIVSGMGGEILVDSVLGQGTTFIVKLPQRNDKE